MKISDRIKELRKEYLHMNQSDFGSPLGLSQSTIGGYENGFRGVSNAVIASICREYGVSEQWLRDGVGDVFVSGSVAPSIISDLTQEYDLDAFDQALISEYLKLDKPTRAALKKKVKEFLKAVENAENDSIEKEVDAYREELKAEKRETSSASDIGNVKEA